MAVTDLSEVLPITAGRVGATPERPYLRPVDIADTVVAPSTNTPEIEITQNQLELEPWGPPLGNWLRVDVRYIDEYVFQLPRLPLSHGSKEKEGLVDRDIASPESLKPVMNAIFDGIDSGREGDPSSLVDLSKRRRDPEEEALRYGTLVLAVGSELNSSKVVDFAPELRVELDELATKVNKLLGGRPGRKTWTEPARHAAMFVRGLLRENSNSIPSSTLSDYYEKMPDFVVRYIQGLE
jgi:hypothetical protein